MPKRITLLEKHTQMMKALKDPSVSSQALLAKKIGISTPTVNTWLADCKEAQSKLSENKKAAHKKRIERIVSETELMIAKGIAAYRAAAMAGVSYGAYVEYKRELTGQSC